jgi:hypothetical protein
VLRRSCSRAKERCCWRSAGFHCSLICPFSSSLPVAGLVAGGALAVVAERRVRGTLERTYELRAAAANRGVAERLPAMSVEEQRHAFMAFIAGLLGDFDCYLARGDVDPLRDGVSYRLTGLWLDDAELAALLGDIITLFEPYLANGPTSGRTRRIVAAVLLPGDEARAPVRIASASIGLGDVERPTTHRPLQRRTTSSLSSRAALSASPRPVQRSVRGGGDACSPGSVAHTSYDDALRPPAAAVRVSTWRTLPKPACPPPLCSW